MDLENLGQLTEPEVAKAVINEIKSFGDDVKKNYDELRKNHEEMKKTVDGMKGDILDVQKVRKLAEDITIRQAAIDEDTVKKAAAMNQRLDQVEVAMKRPASGIIGLEGKEAEKFLKEVKDFHVACKSIQSKSGNGVSYEEIEAIEKAANMKEYQDFCKAFDSYVRRYGGSRERVQPENEMKALQVGVDSDGGITVPTAMSNRITQIVYESDPIRQLAAVESITTGKIEWSAEWDEAGYEWEGETKGETTLANETSTPGWKKRAISVHTLAARPKATQTLLEDSGINIEQWLAAKVADKFARAEGAAFVTGDGIGKPRGFLTYSNGTTFGTIEQVAMGAASALTADGFVRIKYAMKEGFLDRGTWLMNRTTVLAALLLKDGMGNYIWSPGMMAQGETRGNILGLPIRMSTTMPAVATNALAVALASWRDAYLIVDRMGINIMRDPYTAKPFVEFYTRKRVGGDVDNWEAIKIGKISA